MEHWLLFVDAALLVRCSRGLGADISARMLLVGETVGPSDPLLDHLHTQGRWGRCPGTYHGIVAGLSGVRLVPPAHGADDEGEERFPKTVVDRLDAVLAYVTEQEGTEEWWQRVHDVLREACPQLHLVLRESDFPLALRALEGARVLGSDSPPPPGRAVGPGDVVLCPGLPPAHRSR